MAGMRLLLALLLLGATAFGDTVELSPSARRLPTSISPASMAGEYSLEDFKDAQALVLVLYVQPLPDRAGVRGADPEIAADYQEKGVALVAISPNDPASVRLDELGYTDLGDSFEDMKIRAKEKAFSFPYLLGGRGERRPARRRLRPRGHAACLRLRPGSASSGTWAGSMTASARPT